MTTRTTPFTRVGRLTLLVAAALAPLACATTTETTRAPKPADLDALKAVGEKAPGTVVWTSARAGLPHLFAVRTDGSDLRQLTKGDFTDWRPRVSPDGTKVLFARSQDEGFTAEKDANTPGTWDLYTVGIDGKGLAKEVEDASWGSWISNDEVLFQRGGKLCRTKLGGEEETVVLDLSVIPSTPGNVAQDATLSPSGHLVALSFVGERPQVGIWHIKKKSWSLVGAGTQIAWAPDGKSVYWVSNRGRGFGELARVSLEHGEPAVDKGKGEAVAKAEPPEEGGDEPENDKSADAPPDAQADPTGLLDLPGKRSHERFPRLSSDGKWMVFGAAKGGGLPDVEDFELYLWEVGTPPKTAVRLTFDAANDRWPDLVVNAATEAKAPAAADDAAKKDEAPAQAEPAAETKAPSDGPDAGQTESTEATEKTTEKTTEDSASAVDEAEPVAGKSKGKAKAKVKAKKRR
jgi:WD40-like Beta Propeller Repeat